MEDATQIGQDRQHQDSTQAYDAAHGVYGDNAPQADNATANMPQASDPAPYSIGGGGGGGSAGGGE